MERQPVNSSAIKSIGHDPDTGTLEIEFHSGRIYQHTPVSADEHGALMQAQSVGKHFNEKFRGDHLTVTRMDEPKDDENGQRG